MHTEEEMFTVGPYWDEITQHKHIMHKNSYFNRFVRHTFQRQENK